MSEAGQLQNYSVDQAAGAVVLVLGAVASLLLVVWQSKCHCKMNLCWIFQCERRPPSEEEMEGLKDQAEKLKEKQSKVGIVNGLAWTSVGGVTLEAQGVLIPGKGKNNNNEMIK